MVCEASRISAMPFDPQVGFMKKQSIEDVGGVSHADVDDLGTERCVLVRDVGIGELAWFGPVLWIDMTDTFGFSCSFEALSI